MVRKAQVAIDLPAYRMVNCDDLAKNRDKMHYSAKGQQELGNRFAAAITELLQQDKARQKLP
jgi:lysophospholipase L1-like esterase